MDESRIGQYSISVTTYPIMALVIVFSNIIFFFQALKHPKVVAIGEFGLDDSWCKDSKTVFANQERIFKQHIKLALKTEKPMVLHLRGPNSLALAKEVLESMVPNNWPIHQRSGAKFRR